MVDPTIYAETYWSDKGKYPLAQNALHKLIPAMGEVPNANDNPQLEEYRQAVNCYYDLYNNGLCNRFKKFEEIFGFAGPYSEDEDYDEDDCRRSGHVYDGWWTKTNIDRVEQKMNAIILAAAAEQRINIDTGKKVA